jgi:hypothetical protein
MRILLPLLVWFALIPATAGAVTVAEIVTLSNAGVSEEVILALIERDRTIFTIDANQLAGLAHRGVSQSVVLAMLRSGRTEPPLPSQNEGAPAASVAPPPDVVVVGHNPERPNPQASLEFPAAMVMVPYVVYVPLALSPTTCRSQPRALPAPPAPTGRFINDPTRRFLNNPAGAFLNNGFPPSQPPAFVAPAPCES